MRAQFKLPALILLTVVQTVANPIPVRYPEGLIHGFVVLRDLQDKPLATGDLLQVDKAGRVTAELVLHFKDGSLHRETAIYTQRHAFQLRHYHLIQSGPSFNQAIDFSLDVAKGTAVVHDKDKDGKQRTISNQLKLPDDLANGMLPTLLLQLDTATAKTTMSMVVATPKPRIVKLQVSPGGDDSFSVGGVTRKAFRYTIKFELGGVAGLVAPLIGKQPDDAHAWIIPGEAPGFLKLETQLFEGGPVWRIELASPTWPPVN